MIKHKKLVFGVCLLIWLVIGVLILVLGLPFLGYRKYVNWKDRREEPIMKEER
jgi:hypothetical protein